MNGIYLSVNNDSDGFQLPINPEVIDVRKNGDGEEFTISKLGSINIPKDAKLSEYRVESYFPNGKTRYQASEFKKPQVYINKLDKWLSEKTPVRYIYVNGSFTINTLTTIESFEYEESDGSGDVYYTIELKAYVPYAPQKMKIVVDKGKKKVVKKKTPARQNKKPQPKTYSLIKGDSLWKLAQKFLGSGTRYPEIQKLNGIKNSQLRRLPIGLKVKIPTK